MIANDEVGRQWLEVQWTNPPSHEQSAIGTLITSDDTDGSIKVLGNAFIISAQDHTAICMAAAHSFEEAKRIQKYRSRSDNLLVAPDFRIKGPTYIKSDSIKTFFLVESKPIVCHIGQLNYIENYDVVIFSVHAPENEKIFLNQVTLDFSAPAIGEEIAVLSNDISIISQEVAKSEIAQRFSLRIGTVTEVEFGSSKIPGQSIYFRTTIPTSPGMSGAPVIRKPVPGQPVIVRGVVSSDISPTEAFSSFLIPGRSTASMLWPAMGLALHCTMPSGDARYQFLSEMVERKIVSQRSDGVRIKLRQLDGAHTQILYIDERGKETNRVLLSMTPHPHIDSS